MFTRRSSNDRGSVVAVRRRRELAAADFLDVLANRFADGRREVGVPLEEPGREALGETEEVGSDENLPVAFRPGADADGRDLDLGRDAGGEGFGDELQNDRKSTCRFGRFRIGEELIFVALDG